MRGVDIKCISAEENKIKFIQRKEIHFMRNLKKLSSMHNAQMPISGE